MSIKNYLRLVKDAHQAQTTASKTFEQYISAKNSIHPLWALDEMPNEELQKGLGVEFCRLTYCPEEPLWGSMFEEDKRSIVCNCSCFNENTKCTAKDCPALNNNHAYFDAKVAHENAIKVRDNAFRRVFGIKAK